MFSKYVRNGDFFEAKVGSTASKVWKHLKFMAPMIREGMGWCIGNGTMINIWEDRWFAKVISGETPNQLLQIPQGCTTTKVAEYIDDVARQWNGDLLRQDFNQENKILRIRIPMVPSEDKRIWVPDKHGHYTVKSAYRLLQQTTGREETNGLLEEWWTNEEEKSNFFKKLWKLRVPAKLRFWVWQAVNNVLPTADVLGNHHVQVNNR